ncbi:hypothetical protein FDZ58_02015 [Ehrlichia ruminantium]|uniref:hypothetical protein n=1 Tax=Ehrlichia ruminantium TaxID=779 RepID=UPI00004A0B4E|nr:hypothetical protein [Ehrlichia ruminantium]KYW98623.1 hypothetical protein AUR40_05130 [Ehrlichia ruminantium]QLK50436.1 hypothetical protein FDZ68_02005 [Ehrlichia ruminantium]QLK51361.1 hypothetical protein FDZ66_02010 [Ehrlichia ruminantium]QLK53196.1 hypothetical protein FDZ64_02010 [Ehrlichia ruminantium]QLK55036.1 hypothetical protein FDZ62_02035 [Ehrlichia ruminantium]
MNKLRSYWLLCILCIFFIAIIVTFFSLMEKFNSNLSIGIINTVLFLVFLSIIATLAHTIMLHRGLPIEHIEKSTDNIQQQMGIFLPISSEELSKIDHKYNITDLTCNSMSGIQDNILAIKQNRGMLSSKNLKIQLDTTIKSELLYNIKNAADINTPGICIVTKSNTQDVKKIIQGCTDFTILYPILKNNNLSLACKYIEFCDDVSKYCFTKKDFQEILKKKVIDHQDPNKTIYQVIAEYFLSMCPMEKFYSNEDHWYSSEIGKMALSFFNIFGTKDILGENGLCSHLKDETLECKALCIESYILYNVTPQHDPVSERKVLSMIQNIYFQRSCDINSYDNLYENRYVNRRGENIADLIRHRIKHNRLYKYICAIASYSSLDSNGDFHNPTDMFIDELLHLENCADAYNMVHYILIDDPTIIRNREYYTNPEINDILQELLGDNQFYSDSSLISAAKNYIMEQCRPHIKLYCEREYLIDIGNVEKVIISPTVRTNIKNLSNVESHNNSQYSFQKQ